jgi:RNA polymerase sigma-70 factor (ECF subfamily)
MMGPDDLGRLLDAHGGALVLAARTWCAAAEDVVQESFLKLAGLRTTPDDPAAWLYRVVRNAAISADRSDRRRVKHESKAATTDWFEPEHETRLDGEAATHALDGLPPDEREVIVLHLWGGRGFVEIGELTQISAATAHRRYCAGLARLRERLDEPCPTKSQPR